MARSLLWDLMVLIKKTLTHKNTHVGRERPIPEPREAEGRLGVGGSGGEAPQWNGFCIYYVYIRTPESLSHT